MQRVFPAVLLLLLATLVVWLLWPASEPAGPVTPPTQQTAAEAAPPIAQTVEPASAAAPAPAPAAAPAEPSERQAAPEPAPATRSCTVRGRTVDAKGQPLAGVAVSLNGSVANDQRLAAWLKDHDEPQRLAAQRTTDADGRFEFSFWPPPPFQFSLRLRADGVATWGTRWSAIEPGATEDLGDVQLERGTLLHGRVVDQDGAPKAKVTVRIDGAASRRSGSGFETWTSATTDHTGAFRARWALQPGEYRLAIDDQELERGERVTLTGDPEQFVDVVLKRLDDRAAIRGLVVDQDGAPVPDAYVHASVRTGGRLISSDRDGAFRVPQPSKDAPERVRLWVTCSGYEAVPDQTEYEWGRTDVRLVLTKGRSLAVRVVRASDGAPFADYTLRVVPIGGFSFNSDDQRPRGQSPHRDGREQVDGLRVGEHQVIVEPKGQELAVGMATVTMTATGAPEVVVRLAANAPRPVRVQFAAGQPVVGARVLLVDPLGAELTDKTPVYALAEWGNSTARKALLLEAGSTDTQGEVVLHAPTDRPLGLCLPGPAHAPLVVPVATFPATGPLVVTVPRAASLLASVGPEAVLAELSALAGIGANRDEPPRRLPYLELVAGDPHSPRKFPEFRERCTMRPDGTFALHGIPPGRWQVLVHCQRERQNHHDTLQVATATVELLAGQETKLAIDLSALLPSELSGHVLHNGAPLANTQIVVYGNLGAGLGGNPSYSSEQVTTDAVGHFTAAVRGTAQWVLWGRQAATGWVMLRSAETVAVAPGQRVSATFTLASGTARVRLLDAAGAPVAKVSVLLRIGNPLAVVSLPPTDAEGWTEQECEAATYEVQVLPRTLQDPKALSEFYRANAGTADPTAAVLVSLGTLTVHAGAPNSMELRLPANW
ncbi:MAG: carboxypeptidase regulatory-like domain-containing protein [Planctomycetes bacterium]|nr:carboxypeptidase regulatory-like domain-containing protein [Planctomycetota bacterium]